MAQIFTKEWFDELHRVRLETEEKATNLEIEEIINELMSVAQDYIRNPQRYLDEKQIYMPYTCKVYPGGMIQKLMSVLHERFPLCDIAVFDGSKFTDIRVRISFKPKEF